MTWAVVWRVVKGGAPLLLAVAVVVVPTWLVCSAVKAGAVAEAEEALVREQVRADRAEQVAAQARLNNDTLTAALDKVEAAVVGMATTQAGLARQVAAGTAAAAATEVAWREARDARALGLEERDRLRAASLTACEAALLALDELARGVE